MTQYELLTALHELHGKVDAAYHITPSESDLESLMDNIVREVKSLINAIKEDGCCSIHFISGGSCGERDHDSEHF